VIRHIVWDWNGTLFDDQDVVLAATNASLRAVGIARHVTADQYQESYRRPMEEFYAELVGQDIGADQWPVLDSAFGEYYLAHMRDCGLNREALAAMDAWAPRGQSLLSMFGHENLLELTGEFELHARFGRIDGRPADPDFGPKAKYLVRHLTELQAQDPTLAPDEVALIGDCADDAYAAFHVGASAVLFTGGSSSRSTLEKVGCPVVDSLTEAVGLLSAL
jgi:phosphoglycolate phosphatase-like HAD superfamily hydrolase